MNLNNYKEVRIYMVCKSYVDGTNRKFIELATNDKKAAQEVCDAYEKVATALNLQVIYWIDIVRTYMK